MASAEMQTWKLPGSLMKTIVHVPKDPPRDQNRTEQAGPAPHRTAPHRRGLICKQRSALRAGRLVGREGCAASMPVLQHGPLPWWARCTSERRVWAGRCRA